MHIRHTDLPRPRQRRSDDRLAMTNSLADVARWHSGRAGARSASRLRRSRARHSRGRRQPTTGA